MIKITLPGYIYDFLTIYPSWLFNIICVVTAILCKEWSPIIYVVIVTIIAFFVCRVGREYKQPEIIQLNIHKNKHNIL